MSFQVRRLDDRPRRSFPWKRVLLGVFAVRKPFLWAFAFLKHRRDEQQAYDRRVNILKRIVLILVVIFFSIFLLAGVVKALVALRVISIQNIATIAGEPLPTDPYGHTNILLLGVGDLSHDGVDLTDTMMVASIDPKTQSVSMLSLPRDLYLTETRLLGSGRINEMYRTAKYMIRKEQKLTDAQASPLALEQMASELGTLLGMDIHHVIKVDFIGFVQVVDAIGGFEIDVPERLVDTQYPGPNYSYQTFAVEKGLQHFDGETALKYARSRHSTSDFDRSARQQIIISLLGEKLKNEGVLRKPDKILTLWNIMQEHSETTMNSRQLISLAQLGTKIDRSKILSMQLNDQIGGTFGLPAKGGFLYAPPRDQYGGASVLLPVSYPFGPEDPVTWKQIQAVVSLFIHAREPYLGNLPIDVLNNGAPPGSSRKLAAELTRYGFTIDQIANAPEPLKEQGASFVTGPRGELAPKAAPTITLFTKLLNVPYVTNPVYIPVEGTGSGKISIVLGKEYEYTPLQYLLLP